MTPMGIPSLALPTPRRLSESREFYTSKTFFTGSPRGFKDRVKWQLGEGNYPPERTFKLTKASAIRGSTAENSPNRLNQTSRTNDNAWPALAGTPEIRGGKKVMLPKTFYGGNTGYSKASTWDPFSQLVLHTDPTDEELGLHRRGMGSPRNASVGLKEYIEGAITGRDIQIEDQTLATVKRIGKQKL